MGIAMSRGKNGATYVVARYLPAGNVTNEGLFKKNVRRPRFDEDGNRVDSSDESSDEGLKILKQFSFKRKYIILILLHYF